MLLSCATVDSKGLQIIEDDSIDFISKMAVVNVNIVTMTNDDILYSKTVLIDSGIITTIQPAEVSVSESYFQIDGADKYIMPGLGDMHTHIEDEKDLLLYLANGVTSVLNMGSTSKILKYQTLVKEGQIRGPNIYASAFVDGVDRGWHADTPERAHEIVLEVKAQGWNFIKAYNSIKKNVFDALMEESKANNLPVIGHGVREPGMENVLRSGYKMVAHAEEFIYSYFNGFDESAIPEAVKLVRETNVYVTPNLSTYSIINLQWGADRTKSFRITTLQREEVKYLSPQFISRWEETDTYSNRNGSLNTPLAFLQKLACYVRIL